MTSERRMEAYIDFKALPDLDNVAGMMIPTQLAISAKKYRVIDGKFWYFSEPCVAAYIKMLDEPSDHATYQDSMDCLVHNVAEIVERVLAEIPQLGAESPRLDLVALGIGTARKEYHILEKLLDLSRSTATRVGLAAVDFSYPLLMYGIRRIKDKLKYEKEEFDLRLYVADYTKCKAGDFGGSDDTLTLITAPGTLHNSPMPDIFDNLKALMTKNTLLLIDAEMVGGRTDEDLCKQYNDKPSKKFFYTPLSLLAKASVEDKDIRDQDDVIGQYGDFKFDEYSSQKITTEVVTAAKLDGFIHSHKLQSETKDSMKLSLDSASKMVMIMYRQDDEKSYVLGHTARFEKAEFAELLDKQGFEIVYECGYNNRHTRYYLLKLKTGDSPRTGGKMDTKPVRSI